MRNITEFLTDQYCQWGVGRLIHYLKRTGAPSTQPRHPYSSQDSPERTFPPSPAACLPAAGRCHLFPAAAAAAFFASEAACFCRMISACRAHGSCKATLQTVRR